MRSTSSRYSQMLAFIAAACIFESTFAQTPPNFAPATTTHLNVTFGSIQIKPAGLTVPQTAVLQAPSLGFEGPNGTYSVFMVDFSVEATNSTDSNTTIWHWGTTGVSFINGAASFTSQVALAPYIPPQPPAGQTHTYGVFLFKEPANFRVPADFQPLVHNITSTDPVSSVPFRIGFNLTKFAGEAQLGGPVAADYYLVTTPVNSTSTTNATSKPTTVPKGSGATICGIDKSVAAIGALGYLVSLTLL